jgi:hypothetical protein
MHVLAVAEQQIEIAKLLVLPPQRLPKVAC